MKPLFSSNTEFKAVTAEIASHLRGTKLGVLREAVAKAHGYRTTPAYQASLIDTTEDNVESQVGHGVECYLDGDLLVFRGYLPEEKHAARMYRAGIKDGEHEEWAKLASGELTELYGLRVCEPEIVGNRLLVTGYFLIDYKLNHIFAHDLIAGFFLNQSEHFPQALMTKVLYGQVMKRIEEDEVYCQWLVDAAISVRDMKSRLPEAPPRGDYALSIEQLEAQLQAFESLRETHLQRKGKSLVRASIPEQEMKDLRKSALTAVGTNAHFPPASTMERVCLVKAIEHGFRRIEKRIIMDMVHPVRGTGYLEVEDARTVIADDGMLARMVADTVLGKVLG